MQERRRAASAWTVVAAAAALLAVTMGTRVSLGLFIGPINGATSIGLATLSLALGTSQLAWGAAQPVASLAAARYGVAPVVLAGGIASAAALAALAAAADTAAVGAALLLFGAAGAAAGSAPLLMGVVAARVSAQRRGVALGLVGAGGSAGQFLLAPVVTAALPLLGWQGALLALAVLALAATPLARALRPAPTHADERRAPATAPQASAWRTALRSRAFWLITAGFGVCGFHVSFLTTHMPGVIELCGLPPTLSGAWLAVVGACNIAGSLASGWLSQRLPMARLLTALYALRAAGVALFLLLPPGPTVLLGFALWMGLTYMATLPPTTGLIASRYGTQSVAALFGIAMAVHQIGSFLGTWLGGLEVEWTGTYRWIWIADMLLAGIAAALHLPLRDRVADAPRGTAGVGATRSAPA